VIDVRGESDDHWYWGHLASRKGLVPANFVEVSSSSGRADMEFSFNCLNCTHMTMPCCVYRVYNKPLAEDAQGDDGHEG
jgi:hypothetical protein